MVGTLDLELTLAERVVLLKAAADPIRLRVLDTLARVGGRCHCELEEELGLGANVLSHHLRVLREAGLLTTQRRGKLVEYRLAADGIAALTRALPEPVRARVAPIAGR
jgi:ArsR family transcriptional regulator, arsenate/arsenite/antimonite-responsive transcriptional repressor